MVVRLWGDIPMDLGERREMLVRAVSDASWFTAYRSLPTPPPTAGAAGADRQALWGAEQRRIKTTGVP